MEKGVKNMNSTSKQHAKHSFAGWNMQRPYVNCYFDKTFKTGLINDTIAKFKSLLRAIKIIQWKQ